VRTCARQLARVARAGVIVAIVAAFGAPGTTWSISAAADAGAARRDADVLKQKVATINQRAAKPVGQPQRTMLTESEVNAYLALDSHSDLPVGVVDPSVAILGPGRLWGRAVVDLDAVRQEKKPTSLLDPRRFLTGRLPVIATGTLRTANGIGRFELESATVGGVPLPKLLLQEIVSYYSRTSNSPGGFSLDDPFQLPARIREIQVEPGRAIVVQ